MADARSYRPYAIFRERRKPFLIWAAPPFLALYAGSALLFMVLVLLDGGPASAQIAGHDVGLWEVLLLAYPAGVAATVLLLMGAWGLLVERPWARLALTYWSLTALLAGLILASLGTPGPLDLARAVYPGAVIWYGAVFWYLHCYGPVRRYYAELAERQARSAAASSMGSSP
jgi:hypothetical protein